MGDPIKFYHQAKSYGFLSNFSNHPISLHGKVWPTSEHYFQAQKFAGTPQEEEVRIAETPLDAARLGRSREISIRRDWNEVKNDVMRKALIAKFTQHENL